jgi:hypothetical protein
MKIYIKKVNDIMLSTKISRLSKIETFTFDTALKFKILLLILFLSVLELIFLKQFECSITFRSSF